MKKTKKSIIVAVVLALVLSIGGLSGCGSETASYPTDGGMLVLKVNPEIAIAYDSAGKVTTVEGQNDDGKKIMETYKGQDNADAKVVAKDVVNAIGEAGYFDDSKADKPRQITLEISAGSKLPNDKFLEEIIIEINRLVDSKGWAGTVKVEGDTDYGVTDYNDNTDYGTNNDGDTDYEKAQQKKAAPAPKPAPAPAKDTDYDDTDYGPNNDGVTDYDDSDYGPNSDGVTDYSDYSAPSSGGSTKPPASSGNSDYDAPDPASDYDDDVSDYDDSDYDD